MSSSAVHEFDVQTARKVLLMTVYGLESSVRLIFKIHCFIKTSFPNRHFGFDEGLLLVGILHSVNAYAKVTFGGVKCLLWSGERWVASALWVKILLG